MDIAEVESYLTSIRYLQEKYKGQIEIESGFEFEYSDKKKESTLHPDDEYLFKKNGKKKLEIKIKFMCILIIFLILLEIKIE